MRGIGTCGFENLFGPVARTDVSDFPGERHECVVRSIRILLNGFESSGGEFTAHELPKSVHGGETFGRVFQKIRKDRIGALFAKFGEKSGVCRFQHVFFGKLTVSRIVRKTELVVIKIRKEVPLRIGDDDVRDVAGFGVSGMDPLETGKSGIRTVDRIAVPVGIGFVDQKRHGTVLMQIVGSSELVDFRGQSEILGKQRLQSAGFGTETVCVPPPLKEHEIRTVPDSNEPMRIEHPVFPDSERVSGHFGENFPVFGGMGIEPSHGGVLKIPNRRDRQYVFRIVAMPGVTSHRPVERRRTRSELRNGRSKKSERKESVGKSFVLGALFFGVVPLSIAMLGFLAAGMGFQASNPSQVNLEVVMSLLPSWVVVPFLFLLLSGLVSTLDSNLSSISSLAGHDVYERRNGKEKGWEGQVRVMAYSRIAMVGLVLGGIAIANVPGITILYLFMFYGTLRASTMLPTVITLLEKKVSESGVFWGITASIAVGLPIFAYGNLYKITPMIIAGSLTTLLASGIITLVASWRQK